MNRRLLIIALGVFYLLGSSVSYAGDGTRRGAKVAGAAETDAFQSEQPGKTRGGAGKKILVPKNIIKLAETGAISLMHITQESERTQNEKKKREEKAQDVKDRIAEVQQNKMTVQQMYDENLQAAEKWKQMQLKRLADEEARLKTVLGEILAKVKLYSRMGMSLDDIRKELLKDGSKEEELEKFEQEIGHIYDQEQRDIALNSQLIQKIGEVEEEEKAVNDEIAKQEAYIKKQRNKLAQLQKERLTPLLSEKSELKKEEQRTRMAIVQTQREKQKKEKEKEALEREAKKGEAWVTNKKTLNTMMGYDIDEDEDSTVLPPKTPIKPVRLSIDPGSDAKENKPVGDDLVANMSEIMQGGSAGRLRNCLGGFWRLFRPAPWPGIRQQIILGEEHTVVNQTYYFSHLGAYKTSYEYSQPYTALDRSGQQSHTVYIQKVTHLNKDQSLHALDLNVYAVPKSDNSTIIRVQDKLLSLEFSLNDSSNGKVPVRIVYSGTSGEEKSYRRFLQTDEQDIANVLGEEQVYLFWDFKKGGKVNPAKGITPIPNNRGIVFLAEQLLNLEDDDQRRGFIEKAIPAGREFHIPGVPEKELASPLMWLVNGSDETYFLSDAKTEAVIMDSFAWSDKKQQGRIYKEYLEEE